MTNFLMNMGNISNMSNMKYIQQLSANRGINIQNMNNIDSRMTGYTNQNMRRNGSTLTSVGTNVIGGNGSFYNPN